MPVRYVNDQQRKVITMIPEEEQFRAYTDVISRAATDEGFYQVLKADPRGVLEAAGITVPNETAVKVIRNTSEEFHILVPDLASVNDETLAAVAGGSCAGSAGSVSTASTLGTCFGSVGSAGSAGSA